MTEDGVRLFEAVRNAFDTIRAATPAVSAFRRWPLDEYGLDAPQTGRIGMPTGRLTFPFQRDGD